MKSHDPLSSYPSPTATYDEVAQSSDLFWQCLQAFHSSIAADFSVPTVGGTPLDLHSLFVQVTTRGGFAKVIRDRKWKEMVVVFDFPTTITSASFVLRKYYQSLLYHFEQAYYFRKETPDPAATNVVDESRNPDNELQPGTWFSGAIDGKFESGYAISVSVGSEQLQGVLYHVPHQKKSHRNRKRSRLGGGKDPFRPESNMSGYNIFFAEHYAKPEPLYYGQEKAINKRIDLLWNNLSKPERQVYEERCRNEISEYKSPNTEPHPQA